MVQEPKPFEILLRAFPGIPHEEAEELIAYGEVRSFPSDTIICHENALASTFYIILQGKVKVSKFINQKTERELKTLRAGDFFGEMALIHNAPRAATVTTVMPTTVLEIKKGSFDRLMRRSASLSMTMAREVSRRLQENEAMAIEDLRIKAGEMAMAYQRLVEQEFTQREFMTSAVEKLKTPVRETFDDLRQIKLETSANEHLKPSFERMADNVQKIIWMLNAVLFLHEIDMILPNFEAVNLGTLLSNLAAQNRVRAGKNQIKVRLDPSTEGLFTMGDPNSIERALNILFNFIIDTSNKNATVQIKASQANSDINIEFQFVCHDYSQDALMHLFERNSYQHQGKYDMSEPSMQLSFARQIIEEHGGEISSINDMGRGKNIIVHLQASL